MAEMKQRRIYLWTVPRSLSTAFLRSMVTVDKCKGIFEPYLEPFMNKVRPEAPPICTGYGSEWTEVKVNLNRKVKGYEYVFIKEMPGHLLERVSDLSYTPGGATHTFLIRHPVKSIKSQISIGEMAKKKFLTEYEAERREEMMFELVMADQTYEPLWEVFKTVTEKYKQKPVVVDADDLQRNPEGTLRAYCNAVGIEYQDSMVNWGKITEEQKLVFEPLSKYAVADSIIGAAVTKTAFERSDPSEVKVTDVDEKYRARVHESLVIYEKLREFSLKPV